MPVKRESGPTTMEPKPEGKVNTSLQSTQASAPAAPQNNDMIVMDVIVPKQVTTEDIKTDSADTKINMSVKNTPSTKSVKHKDAETAKMNVKVAKATAALSGKETSDKVSEKAGTSDKTGNSDAKENPTAASMNPPTAPKSTVTQKPDKTTSKKETWQERYAREEKERKEKLEAETKAVLDSLKEDRKKKNTDRLDEMDELSKGLYDIIHIKSSDVEFGWDTDMLMHKIIRWGAESETTEDLKRALNTYAHGDILYKKCKPYIKQIFDYSKKAEL